MRQPILLVDDDLALCSLMDEYFSAHEFQIDCVHDGSEGLARALRDEHELVVLDVMLPSLDGFEVLRQLRRKSPVPVIMLTALSEKASRIEGLESGADDYLSKPFSPDELLARMRAVLRRTGKGQLNIAPVQLGELTIHRQSQEVWAQGQRIELTAIEFDILDLLTRSVGQIVSRDQLSAVLYQRKIGPLERTIDVHVCHLRKKFEPYESVSIRTIRGTGYLFVTASGAKP